jgi:hypothetical protein
VPMNDSKLNVLAVPLQQECDALFVKPGGLEADRAFLACSPHATTPS